MFSSKDYLERKTGPYGIGRFSYLQSLVTEFQDTDSDEAKEQVLANLANFAYDPINYDYLRILKVTDLFLDCLSEKNEKIVEFACGGICNFTLDKRNKEYLLKNGAVNLLIDCLSSTNEETVLSTITCLIFLVTPESKEDITSLPVVDAMLRFSHSSNTRLSNLATVFLEDYCTPARVKEARQTWIEEETIEREKLSTVISTDQRNKPSIDTGQESEINK